MWHVVVELEVVIDDGMLGMVELDEVFEGSSSLVWVCFDIVGLDGWDFDGLGGGAEKARNVKWV